MAVANAWATGNSAVPPPQLRPFSNKKCSVNFPKQFLLRRRQQGIKFSCYCSNNLESENTINSSICSPSSSSSSSEDWDWDRWTQHFTEIEQIESYASVLKFQLDDAIEKEDFREAAKLKIAIAETKSKDSIAEITSQLKNAIDEERYRDASTLCQNTGSGLVGWWVGYSENSDDPFGRLIRITPGTGRFVGRSYSPKQLINSSSGTPLLEIFVVKDANETYKMQVVYLKKVKGKSTNSTDKSTKNPSEDEIGNPPVVDTEEDEENESEKIESKIIDLEGATEEGIKGVMNFLKEKIPELKFKVMKVNVTGDITEDKIKQLIEEEENENSTSENEDTDIENSPIFAEGGFDLEEDENNLDAKLYIGEVLHKKEDTHTSGEFVRIPAEIKDIGRDYFVFHVPKKFHGFNENEENVSSKFKVASELMPRDVAKTFWTSDTVTSKISRDVREIVKHAVQQAQKHNRLPENTNFSRITIPEGDLDPFDGLYVGAFGPYGTEVVQLKRKYGNWNLNNDEKSSDVEFFEYVEAVKLTGDLNVPAGQVTFHAKIGKGSRLANRGLYPDELGVVASYKGQGRIAELGFKNPKWVEGEFLQLNGKGLGPYVKGADLGFLYVVPEQSFLVLFNRLKLPE